MISKRAVEVTTGGLLVAGASSYLAPRLTDIGFVDEHAAAFQTGGEIVFGLGMALASILFVRNSYHRGMREVTGETGALIVPSNPTDRSAGVRHDMRRASH